MIPAKFEYKRAQTVEEAIHWLGQYGGEAKLLAGGHSLIPSMKLRLSRPSVLIDIGKIEVLRGIREEGDALVIGANTTHAEIASSSLIKEHANVLSQAAGSIGDIQVRNAGTIGGSLAHADPAADYPAAVLAAEAVIVVQGPQGKRTVRAEDFFKGMFATALEEQEIVVEVRIPKGSNGVYLKFKQPASRYALVGVAALRRGDGVNVGITGASDTPYRATAVEQAYPQEGVAAAQYASEGVEMLEDHFATAAYRAHLVRVLTRRALEAL